MLESGNHVRCEIVGPKRTTRWWFEPGRNGAEIGCGKEAAVSAGPAWQPFDVQLSSPQRAGSRLKPMAPISLSLRNGTFGSRVDVTQLSLVDRQADLISNGSFEHGLDRWFAASDMHLAWKVKSTPLQIAFEQGALGVLAWLVLGVAAIAVVLRPSVSPGSTAAFAAAMIGFAVVGCFDTLFDSPRVILLIALIGAIGPSASGGSRYVPSFGAQQLAR